MHILFSLSRLCGFVRTNQITQVLCQTCLAYDLVTVKLEKFNFMHSNLMFSQVLSLKTL